MTTIIRTIAFSFVTLFFALTSVSPAFATERLSVTVRITDMAAVERSIGACDSEYALRDENNAGSGLVAFRGGRATLHSPIAGDPVAPMFYCEGARVGFPSTGIEFQVH